MIELRDAVMDDAAAIARTYNESVVGGTATWQVELDSECERRLWLAEHGGRYPVIVAVSDNDIVGWGSISPFRPREGWLPTVENSIYVAKAFHRQGIGRLILNELIARARIHGFHSIVAGIDAAQDGSIAMHAKAGFVEVGRIVEGGAKFDRRLDCVFLQLML